MSAAYRGYMDRRWKGSGGEWMGGDGGEGGMSE